MQCARGAGEDRRRGRSEVPSRALRRQSRSLAFPSGLDTARVVDGDAFKITIALHGECGVLQANLVLAPVDDTHQRHEYVPLVCVRDVSLKCRATLNTETDPLQAASYRLRALLVTTSSTAAQHDAVQWDLGVLDATRISARRAPAAAARTSDQREDVFEKTLPEMRPPFAFHSSRAGTVLPAVFATAVLLPWIYLVSVVPSRPCPALTRALVEAARGRRGAAAAEADPPDARPEPLLPLLPRLARTRPRRLDGALCLCHGQDRRGPPRAHPLSRIAGTPRGRPQTRHEKGITHKAQIRDWPACRR